MRSTRCKAEAERKKKQKKPSALEKKARADEKKGLPRKLQRNRRSSRSLRSYGRHYSRAEGKLLEHSTSTDFIEQNKRLNLEKKNYELSRSSRSNEEPNRSVLSNGRTSSLRIARKNLTKHAASYLRNEHADRAANVSLPVASTKERVKVARRLLQSRNTRKRSRKKKK